MEREKVSVTHKLLPPDISTAELLAITGLPRRTVSGWKVAGLIKPNARGRWPVAETLTAIVNHLKVQAPESGTRAALIKEQVRAKRLASDAVERNLIPRADCEAGWVQLAGTFVAALETLPSRLAGLVVGLESPAEVRAIAKREVNQVREQVAHELDQLAAGARGDDARGDDAP